MIIIYRYGNEINKISDIGINLIRRQLKYAIRLIVYSK